MLPMYLDFIRLEVNGKEVQAVKTDSEQASAKVAIKTLKLLQQKCDHHCSNQQSKTTNTEPEKDQTTM